MLFDKKEVDFQEKFESMGLIEPVSRAIQQLQFRRPTEIQKKSIPLIMTGRDIIACARTGTGKTASFCIPLIDRLKAHSDIVGARALIIVPTRDLALQTL